MPTGVGSGATSRAICLASDDCSACAREVLLSCPCCMQCRNYLAPNPCKAKGKGCAWSTGFGVRRAPREQSWPSRSSSALGTPGERCGRARTRGCCTAKRWGGLHMLGGQFLRGCSSLKKMMHQPSSIHGPRCAMARSPIGDRRQHTVTPRARTAPPQRWGV